MRGLEVVPVHGLGEVVAGTDLGAEVVGRARLLDGDVVVVTSKVVSKAAGRVVTGDRADLVTRHSIRTVARRGATRIVRTAAGLTLAAAGLDASNTRPGTVVLLPEDADASAGALRRELLRRSGANVAVVVTDTAGRAWRTGQTDIAIGVAGLPPLLDLAGEPDSHGTPLAVTAPALADEVAAAADLVQGKLTRVPVAVVRGLAGHVLPVGVDGPGAAALVRPPDEDLFGWGAADAVRVAVRRDGPAGDGFPRPDAPVGSTVDDALAALPAGSLAVTRTGPSTWAAHATGTDLLAAAFEAGALAERLEALAVSTRRSVTLSRGRHPEPLLSWTMTGP